MIEQKAEQFPINGTAVEIGKVWCVFVFMDKEMDADSMASEPLLNRPDLLPQIPERVLELMSFHIADSHDKEAMAKEWHVLTVNGTEILGVARTRTFEKDEPGAFTLIQWRTELGTKVRDFSHLYFGIQPGETPVLIVNKKRKIGPYQRKQGS